MWHDGINIKLKQKGKSHNILNLLCNFLRNRKQKVVLKRQTSSLAEVNARVPQGSTFGPFLFLKNINNLTDDLSNAKLFTNDTSLFSVVCYVNTSADEVFNDLVKINKWTYQWKMSFNSDPIKQAQQVEKKAKKTIPHWFF